MKRKRIAVQEGLHETAQLLKRNGYHVTTIDHAEEPIDVIIYSGNHENYMAHNMSGYIKIPSNNQFVKMINIDEIPLENIISNIEELE